MSGVGIYASPRGVSQVGEWNNTVFLDNGKCRRPGRPAIIIRLSLASILSVAPNRVSWVRLLLGGMLSVSICFDGLT